MAPGRRGRGHPARSRRQIRPWVQPRRRRRHRSLVDFDPGTGEALRGRRGAALSERTRLVALTAASNLIGTRPRYVRSRLVHAAGALLYVDGVHYAAHSLVDLSGLGADFFVCSPYKFCGPHLGVLAALRSGSNRWCRTSSCPPPIWYPERFEFGTLPYELSPEPPQRSTSWRPDLSCGQST